jgi:hypothetical protein
MEFQRLENESDEELIYRVCSQKEIIGTWEQVKDILNELTGNDFGESTYRKKYSAFEKMLRANQGKFYEGAAALEELKVQQRALEREKVKFRDERRAWNKQNYIDSRVEEKLDILKEADYIFREEISKAGLEGEMSQYFAVLTDVRSVGVMGDERTYDYMVALRSVKTSDFMTASWVRIPYEVLEKVSSRIVNEVKNVNRVVYDITSKPPATIEWE